MSEKVTVQYVGFEAKKLVREYRFLVRQASAASRELTVAIANEAFSSARIRYQEAPDICSLKLRRELGSEATGPQQVRYCINDVDLGEYREAHAPKTPRKLYTPKAERESS